MSEPHIDVEGRALAASMFPREWEAAEGLTGKRRSNLMASLRRRARVKLVTDLLREAGHSCADCSFYQHKPFSLGGKGRYCDYHSDSGGYLLTQPDDICTDHKTTLSSALNPHKDA